MVTILSRRSVICALAGGAALAMAPRTARAALTAKGIYPVAVPNYQTMFVAMGKGFIKDEGVDCKLIQGGNGVKTREIIASGQGDFAIADFVHPLLLTNKGRPAKVIVGADSISAGLQFMLRADLYAQGIDTLQKFAAWKRPDGHKPIIGVSSIGGTNHVWGTYYMEQLGLDTAVTWVGAGDVETMLGSLKTKQIDILINTWSLAHEVESKGWGKVIFDGSDPTEWNKTIGGKVPVTAHYCLQATIERDPALVQAWANALLRAAHWITTHSIDEIYEVIEPYVGSTSRESNLIEIKTMKEVINPNGIVDEADYARGGKVWFREMTGVKPVPLADIYAGEFIRKANEKYPA
jgi:NitT/TauT family transport system substrate-binding protein